MQRRFPVLLAAAAALAFHAAPAAETNGWPFWVAEKDRAGEVQAWQAVGPLFFGKPGPADGSRLTGWRPFYLREEAGAETRSTAFYPFFTWSSAPDRRTFSFFELVNHIEQRNADDTVSRGFDIWPFYFSRDTGDPATSYRALLPVAGTIKRRLGYDTLSWVAFPLHVRSSKAGMNTHYAPWPFLRLIEGEGHSGFEFWPFYGKRERAGDYRREFALWPFLYRHEKGLSKEVPEVRVGALPFYTRESGPGYVSANYGWPFFGYTHRTEPVTYHETRYFWPLLVQGHGERQRINRWAPFYTYSRRRDAEKTWLLWPLYRQATWEADGVAQRKDQFLFLLYWSLEQRSLTNPDAAPAHKRHLWPLYSSWDNGAGRRQVQVLSPLEIFFPRNDTVRNLYTPLFALWRHDVRGPDEEHWSLLWHAVTWHRTPERREFHLGPLFSYRRDEARARVALGRGLIGFRRPDGGGWRPFLFDFNRPQGHTRLAHAPASP